MALIDRVKYDALDDTSFVWKYPSEDLTIGSQVIVNLGQEVIFVKGGQALDLFEPGTHTLSTGNIPLLNKLINLPFGGIKNSGIGRTHGHSGFKAFSNHRSVLKQSSLSPLKLLYPPYTSRVKRLIKLL